jgi:hypothetical protein
VSAERDVEVHADLDDNAATVTETREVSELFNDDGELRLWEDNAGWNGYIREQSDEETAYYVVNTRHDEDCWIRKVRVGQQAVIDAVENHISDPKAGGRGRFVRRCSPP